MGDPTLLQHPAVDDDVLDVVGRQLAITVGVRVKSQRVVHIFHGFVVLNGEHEAFHEVAASGRRWSHAIAVEQFINEPNC